MIAFTITQNVVIRLMKYIIERMQDILIILIFSTLLEVSACIVNQEKMMFIGQFTY